MSVLRQLNDAIDSGTPQARLRALWHATDLLVSGQYSDDEIWTLGDVIERLAAELEQKARAQLAERLATSDNGPPQVLRKLALDDCATVAAPVLHQSRRLDLETLRACASTQSQQHLMAIARRHTIPEPITDILIQRGDQNVVRTTAANPGARFSESGFLNMLKRSQNDSILAEIMGSRKDIPRHVFQQLIAKASDEVRSRLSTSGQDHVAEAVAGATAELQSKFGPASATYFAARKAVTAEHSRGALAEREIAQYALAHKLDETMVGLSLLTGLPTDVIERALTGPDGEMTIVVCKSLGFCWETTTAVLFVRAHEKRMRTDKFEDLKREFERLDKMAARQVLANFASVKSASAAKNERRHLPQLRRV